MKYLLLSIISLTWSLVANDVERGVCESEVTLTNSSSIILDSANWEIGYCHMSVSPMVMPDEEIHIQQICASYHLMTPTSHFRPLQPGESRTFRVRHRGGMMRETSIPQGAFIVLSDGTSSSVPVSLGDYLDPWIFVRKGHAQPYADGEWMYQHNAQMPGLGQEAEIGLVPMPKQCALNTHQLSQATRVLKKADHTQPEEGYRLVINAKSITLYASTNAGFFYAEATLNQLRELYPNGLPTGEILDYPTYPYRGMMLDIARNYTCKKDVMDLLAQLASYKINRLHFHLVDDEAWRIEIPGLPELTEVASHRGYTTDERRILYPAYSDAAQEGYLTRQDFIDILRFAAKHHIQIIPEFDLPGHSRAAIKAMEARYHAYKDIDLAKATEYLLTDFAAAPKSYVSAQYYTDNVMAVHLPSAEHFVLKVMTEIQRMYKEAGVVMTYFNIGGDEVADGALGKDEHRKFIQRLNSSFRAAGLHAAGWEELALWLPAEEAPLCYCWKPGQKKAVELSSQGYPVVLSCADYLYVDMCYVNHQEEKALHWAAYVDEQKTFAFHPEAQGDNVLGIQAQLFAETIREYAQVQRYLFPKMFGIIHHAWNGNAEVTNVNSLINAQLACRETHALPYHLTQPGIHVENGLVSLNCPVSFAEVHYTIDGTEPTRHSPLYSEPFAITGDRVIRARAFTVHEQSNCTWWKPGLETKARGK